MAEWNWREEGQEDKKENKAKKYVTRREFYVCFVLLLAVILWQGEELRSRIHQAESYLESRYSAELNGLRNQISNIPNGVENALLEADNPLREYSIDVVDVDMKGKTATLRMMAAPKEYQDGMELLFFVSCDGGDSVSVSAGAGADRIYTAELEVPFCGEASATAHVVKDGAEQIESIGSVFIEGQVMPWFSGYRSGSVSWMAGKDYAEFDGTVGVDVQKPEWMMQTGEKFMLKNAKTEIFIDGKLEKTIDMEFMNPEDIENDGFVYNYAGAVPAEEELYLKEGETVEFIFRAEDNNGLKYSYLVERGCWTREDGYMEEAPAASTDGFSDGRLTVE